MKPIDDRYQNQKWYVKLWRKRHIVPVPYFAFRWWLKELKQPLYDKDGRRRLNFKTCLSVQMGMADHKMKHYFTQEEVRERFS